MFQNIFNAEETASVALCYDICLLFTSYCCEYDEEREDQDIINIMYYWVDIH